MNEPPAFAVSAAGTVATTFPLIWITIGELATYPVPMICTVLPVLVVVGVKVITGIVRVNVALATFPAASVMVKLLVGVAVSGIANVAAEIAPAPVVVVALKVTATPLTLAVIALDAAKPVPDTVIVAPLLPVVGVIVIAGPTVIAVWALRPVFESIKVSRYVPANRLVGTRNVVVFVNALAPEAETEVEPNAEVDIRSIPPNDANEIADRPVTVMVTLAPDATVAGAAIVGAPSTVMVASAVSVGLAAVNRTV